MKTKHEVHYQSAPYGAVTRIPKGTAVVPANNLPDDGKFWAAPWPNMSETEQSWHRNYGFLIEADEVE